MAKVGNSTVGMKVFYSVETTAGTRPTAASAYTQIPGIKEIPGLGEEATAIDVTPLEELEFMRYVAGLKDTGGNIAFVANNTNAFQTAWSTLQLWYPHTRRASQMIRTLGSASRTRTLRTLSTSRANPSLLVCPQQA